MPFEPKPIIPPWKGVVDNLPTILAPSNSFASCDGFWIDKQRLRSVPKRTALPVWAPASGPIVGVRSFMDAAGNVHSIVITATQGYYYVNGVYTALSLATPNGSLIPIESEVFQNVLIYTNGSDQPIAVDGSAVTTSIALPNSGSCFFLGKIASRMLYLNLIDPGLGLPGSTDNPRRFRWSKINDANNFSDFTAGTADIPEVEDAITGFALQGAIGYIYRSTGITTLTPTGGISPTFYVESYTGGGTSGVGNYYPYSLSQFGNMVGFVAQDDVYAFNPLFGPPTPIGGAAARSIFTDISASQGYLVGKMVPTLAAEKQGLQYWLAIPFADNSSALWTYFFESQSWMKQTFPFRITCINNVALD